MNHNPLTRYQPLLPPAEFAELLQALQQPQTHALRLNPLKVDPAEALAAWPERYGWQVQPAPYSNEGWLVSGGVPLSQTLDYRFGRYYIQDAASMLPASLFDLPPAPLILDMAAAPGGKTIHLVSRTRDHGLVVANDSAAGRAAALKGVLSDWGAINTAVTCFQGERFGSWFPEGFDAILLDAPCSMENLRASAAHPHRPVSAREREGLAQRQLRLLTSAFYALRPGGQVVYSTCTLAPEEDEGVLDALLQRFPGLVQIDAIQSRLPHPAPGLTQVEEQVYHASLANAARIWPHHSGTAGFFAARLSKTGSTGAAFESSTQPYRPLDASGLLRLKPAEEQNFLAMLADQAGFDASPLLQDQHLGLWQRGATVMALPEAWIEHFSNLPFCACGLPIGEKTPDGFLFSHEWITRFGPQFTRARYILPEARKAAWLRGEDLHAEYLNTVPGGKVLPGGNTLPRGYVLVFDEAGQLLGRGKITSDRLKNLLPRRSVTQY